MVAKVKATKSPDVAALEVLGSLFEKATSKSAEFVAMQTQAYSEQNKAALSRQSADEATIRALRAEIDQAQKDLATERSKNLDRDVAFKRLENEKARAEFTIGKVLEGIGLLGDKGVAIAQAIGQAKARDGAPSGALNAATVEKRPPTEALLDAFIGDLSARTAVLVWNAGKPLFLPTMATKDFLGNLFLLLNTREIQTALMEDMGSQSSERLKEIARAAGLM